jgi:hypothetical protein
MISGPGPPHEIRPGDALGTQISASRKSKEESDSRAVEARQGQKKSPAGGGPESQGRMCGYNTTEAACHVTGCSGNGVTRIRALFSRPILAANS